jgi:hypothetical protein
LTVEEPRLVEIVREAVDSGHCTKDVGGNLGTSAVGDWVCARIRG